ncbi:hypothetical protein ES702_03260 [subsurface metagenome]
MVVVLQRWLCFDWGSSERSEEEGQADSAVGGDGMVGNRCGVFLLVDGSKRKEAVWANPAPGFWCGGGHKERGVRLQLARGYGMSWL